MAVVDWSNMTGLLGNDEGTGFADKLSQGVGNLLGGGNADLFDPSQKRAAANNALLNFSIGLLKGSAPSFDPSHRSFANALGEGLSNAQQGYQAFTQNQLSNAQNAMKLNQMRNQLAVGQMIAGGSPSAAGAPVPMVGPRGPAAVPVGGAPASGGTQPDQVAAAQAAADATGMPQPTSNRYVIPGMDRQMAGAYYMSDPAGYMKTLAESYKLGDFQRQAADVYGYGTPEYMQAIKAKIDNETTMPMRPGGAYKDSTGLHYTAPAPQPGYQYKQGPNGDLALVPIPGANEAMQANAAAVARGQGENQIQMVPMADGTEVPMTRTQAAQYLANNPQGPLRGGTSGGGMGPGSIENMYGNPQPAQTQTPAQAQNSLIQFKEPPKVASPSLGTLSPASKAVQGAVGEAAGKQYAADVANAGNYQAAQQPIVGALHALQQAETGPVAARKQAIQSTLNELIPTIAQVVGVTDPSKVTATDLFKKYTAQIGMGQMAAAGGPSDARLNSAIAGSPNISMDKMANSQVLQKMAALNDMNQYMIADFQNRGLDPAKWPAFKAQAAKQLDPAVFAIDYMSPAQKAAFQRTLTPAQKQKFIVDYNKYKQSSQ